MLPVFSTCDLCDAHQNEASQRFACCLPLQICAVGAYPGDWLYADEDGMVLSARRLQ